MDHRGKKKKINQNFLNCWRGLLRLTYDKSGVMGAHAKVILLYNLSFQENEKKKNLWK